MIPRYQDRALDTENRIKRRVIKSLDKAYANMIDVVDGDGDDTAQDLYIKTDTLLTSLTSLFDEATSHFNAVNGGRYTVSDYLSSVLGKTNVASNQLKNIMVQFRNTFNYLSKEQVSALENMFDRLNSIFSQFTTLVGNSKFDRSEMAMSGAVSRMTKRTALTLQDAYTAFNDMAMKYNPATRQIKGMEKSQTMDGGYRIGGQMPVRFL